MDHPHHRRTCEQARLYDVAFGLRHLPAEDNDATLHHLACVADHLADGGLYVLEMGHPRDSFRVGTASTQTSWTAEDNGLRAIGVPLDNQRAAWRRVVVLRKRAGAA